VTVEVFCSRGVSLPQFSRDRPKTDGRHKFDFSIFQRSSKAEKIVSFNVRIVATLLAGVGFVKV
jgi:hypothetical protein